ncbi:MAG TPA: hypothetical protein RMH99_08555 [Sandaracinaceae bacterium LLY-WYZ-13_1]|nr:hypothetical protein [Sandaracinaceae bacterium LLY-WYZ-13_1]
MPDGPQGRGGGADEPAELFRRLRERLFRGTAASYGLEPETRVWGVAMEMGYPEGTALVACLSDGRAQLSFSHGGALLGGGEHESVRLRAKAIVEAADRFLAHAARADELPLPLEDHVHTYFLTDDGVLVAETSQRAMEPGHHELSPLLHAGQTVVTELIRIARAQERGEPPE